MKKVALFSVIIVMITLSISHAAIITVDNKTPSIGDYTTLQAAHDAASDGDTIYIYPSGAVYNAITVTKTLAFVGTGFDYPSEGMNTTLLTGTMTFGAGSDGSKLEGFGGSFSVTIDEDNIIIKRNSVQRIHLLQNHTGAVILQNYLCSDGSAYLIEVENYNEVLIANNKLVNRLGIYASQSSTTITILHNVISSSYRAILIDNSIDSSIDRFIANNIIVIDEGYCTGGSTGFFYNMSNSSQLLEGNGNIINVDMSAVFVDPGNYDFHLLPDSPAIGAGLNGVDMGIYGGSTPYVDGGAPCRPSIFYLESDHVGSQQTGLDVTIKAKSNMQ